MSQMCSCPDTFVLVTTTLVGTDSKRMRWENTRCVLAGGRVYGSAKCYYEDTQRRFTSVAWLPGGTRRRGGLEHGELGDSNDSTTTNLERSPRTTGVYFLGAVPSRAWNTPRLLQDSSGFSWRERRHAANSLELQRLEYVRSQVRHNGP